MGSWSATIGGNDYYLNIEANAVEICGLDFFDYLKNNSILTGELFSQHFNSILSSAKKVDAHEGFLSLGALIMRNGANFPDKVKSLVLKEIDRELSTYSYEDERYKYARRLVLKDFKNSIKNYRVGIRVFIREESLIGKSFVRKVLIPILKHIKNFGASDNIRIFIETLAKDLSFPMIDFCKVLHLNSRDSLIRFFESMRNFALSLKERHQSVKEDITFLSEAFLARFQDGFSIEDLWLNGQNIDSLMDLPEDEWKGDAYGIVYKVTMRGGDYVGQSTISTHKRTAQHISKFIIAP